MNELDNALAWFRAAPENFYKAGTEKLEATGQWIWEVLQGDFNDDQTVAQAVTGTVISMIPLVDQICDVRDVVANCKKIKQDSSNTWHWLALALTLVGLFPTLGSLVKGCFKVLFAYGRKGIFSAGKVALDADLWKATQPFVEAGIRKLNDFLARPEVRKTLAVLKIDNPYKYLAEKLREVAGQVNVSRLLAAMDSAINALNKLLALVQKWGNAAMKTQAGELLKLVKEVRGQANAKLADVLKPLQQWLNKLARRLEIEADQSYRAATNAINPHSTTRLGLDTEIMALRKAPPEWVTVGKHGKYPAAKIPPAVPEGHFDIGEKVPKPLKNGFETFTTDVRADRLPPGTLLYRVVDPGSWDNSTCWMTEAEFRQLTSKAQWRERFAVWANWNGNGEYLTYTVPPGPGLPVWRGTTASQYLQDRAGNAIKADDKGNLFWAEGGAEQLMVHPDHLDPGYASKRQATEWGYGEGDIDVSLVGVPTLTNNWIAKKN